jgi:hypothetical protein
MPVLGTIDSIALVDEAIPESFGITNPAPILI